MTRPKLPNEVKNEVRVSLTILNEHKEFLDRFVNKSKTFRIIMFELMPKMVQLFIKNRIKADLSNEELNIIKNYVEVMKDARG